MNNRYANVHEARIKFEKVLSGYREYQEFRADRRFQDSLTEYHRAIALQFAYDLEGFVDFFFVNSRRNAGFEVLTWYVEKLFRPLQLFLKQSEVASWLGDYKKSFVEEKNLKEEIQQVRELYYKACQEFDNDRKYYT